MTADEAVHDHAARWRVLLSPEKPPGWALTRATGIYGAACWLEHRVVWLRSSLGLPLDPITLLHEIHHVALGALREDFDEGVVGLDAATARGFGLGEMWRAWMAAHAVYMDGAARRFWHDVGDGERRVKLALSVAAARARGALDERGQCTYRVSE